MSDTRNGYSASELVRRGWTPKAIAALLGEPDELADNPHFTDGAKMKIFRRPRVHAAEATEAFRAATGRTKKGKANAMGIS